MSKNIYSLRIWCSNEDQIKKISKVLNVSSNSEISNTWIYEVIEYEHEVYFDFINHFLDILEEKYMDLKSIGIQSEDISIWLLYEYKEQCNMEFLPQDLKRIGENNIRFCISCWSE